MKISLALALLAGSAVTATGSLYQLDAFYEGEDFFDSFDFFTVSISSVLMESR